MDLDEDLDMENDVAQMPESYELDAPLRYEVSDGEGDGEVPGLSDSFGSESLSEGEGLALSPAEAVALDGMCICGYSLSDTRSYPQTLGTLVYTSEDEPATDSLASHEAKC